MVTAEEVLVHPLFLLLIGAGASVGIGSLLTNWFESRRRQRDIEVEDRRKEREIAVERNRKELEIKADIASKMAEAVAHQAANALTSVGLKKEKFDEDDKHAYYEDMNGWYTQAHAIRLKLESYFPEAEPNIAEKWHRYFGFLLSFSKISRTYFYKEPREDQKRDFIDNVKSIRDYLLSDNKEIDWDRFTKEMKYDDDLWQDVLAALMHRGDKIIKEVLKLRIKAL